MLQPHHAQALTQAFTQAPVPHRPALAELPAQHFAVILADPPWSYHTYSVTSGRSKSPRAGWRGVATRHYDTMTLDDICALPVGQLAAPNCALFLWATMPCLPEAFRVIKEWGFAYKTVGFTWIKTNKSTGNPHLGLGHYTRGNAELCLLATRGRLLRQAKDVSQAIISPRLTHSEKPPETYHRIERLYGGPYVELFARRTHPGWTVWGDEAPLQHQPPLF